ncbi:hypothetical protein [Polaromonas sp.]|uniref:hypothetical protein n=1 Tax=Polaromonas sp. TaxID=1869339 RepID=UPI0032635643
MNARPNSPKKPSDPVEKALMVFFALLLVMPALWSSGYLYVFWTTDEVVSTRAIGNFVSMSGPGGWGGAVVLETDLGSFPLHSAASITKGTPLMLELRASGQRFICDARHTHCLKTHGPDFGPAWEGVKP